MNSPSRGRGGEGGGQRGSTAVGEREAQTAGWKTGSGVYYTTRGTEATFCNGCE